MESAIHPISVATSFIKYTSIPVFLTGPAGSGKTTFLKSLDQFGKTYTVVAPTGVAAMNAGGGTIHSLFNLKPALYLPGSELPVTTTKLIENHASLLLNTVYTRQKKTFLQRIELLVIDEVSMVRADVIDAIDVLLRNIRSDDAPFGGVQILLTGDLFQLPPIADDEDKRLLEPYYPGMYFFYAKAFQAREIAMIELSEIHRQKDEDFKRLLARIRNNSVSEEDMQLLGRHQIPESEWTPKTGSIILCSHNEPADRINQNCLNALPGDTISFEAGINGSFDSKNFPSDQKLNLKKGAQVIFVKNDLSGRQRYYNGKIGKVSKIDITNVSVRFIDGTEVQLEKETWQNLVAQPDETGQNLLPKSIGEFHQFPVRLAWAITIHKSQGLTFEKATIDAEQSFEKGQVYVALSRLRSLEGLTLLSGIKRSSLEVNPDIIRFMNERRGKDLDEIFKSEKIYQLYALSRDLFRFTGISLELDKLERNIPKWKLPNRINAIKAISILKGFIDADQVHCSRFSKELLQAAVGQDLPFLQQRLSAAGQYFQKRINENYLPSIADELSASEKKDYVNYHLQIEKIIEAIRHFITRYDYLETMIANFISGKSFEVLWDDYRNSFHGPKKEENRQSVISKTISKSLATTLAMSQSNMSVPDIAIKRNMSEQTIQSHVLDLVGMEKLQIEGIISKDKLAIIKAALAVYPDIQECKEHLGAIASFFEIRLVQGIKQNNDHDIR